MSPSTTGLGSRLGYTGSFSSSFDGSTGFSGSLGFGETASATSLTSSFIGEVSSASFFSASDCSLKHLEQRKFVF